MGKELEYKLHISDEETLQRILADAHIASYVSGGWQQTPMQTTYYDTPERSFCAHRFTLRQRQEGERSIVCVKTPLKESHARGEWQICAERIDDAAIEELIVLGAPKQLLLLYAGGKVEPVCGAKFLRRHVMLTFPDGSKAELAGDCGYLHGSEERQEFTELELELYEGEAAQMLQLVRYLCSQYGLHEQPKSKYARARALK